MHALSEIESCATALSQHIGLHTCLCGCGVHTMIATEAILSKPTTARLKIKFNGQRLEDLSSAQPCELGSNVVRDEWGNNKLVHNDDHLGKRKLQKGFSKSFDAKVLCASQNQNDLSALSLKKRRPGELEGPEEKRKKMDRSMSQKCSVLLKELMKPPIGWIFSEPVDPAKLNIPDYFDVIKTPMDLGTVKYKLQKNAYSSSEDFAADVRLTFANAILYNPPSNPIHEYAENLNELFEVRWKSLVETLNTERPKVGQARTLTVLLKKGVGTSKSATKIPLIRSVSLPRKGMHSEGDHNRVHFHGKEMRAETSEAARNCKSNAPIKNFQKGTSNDGQSFGHGTSAVPSSAVSFRCGVCAKINCQCSVSSDSYNASSSDITTERSLDRMCPDASKLDSQARSTITSHMSKSDPDSDGAGSASDDGTACPRSHSLTPADDASCMEGLTTQVLDVHLSPKKALRAAILKRRYADTIIKAQQKTLLDQGDKVDPLRMQQEKERLERRQLEEKSRIEAQIRAAEAAARRKAEIESREQREREREAARIALQKMEKTVEIEQNADILKELEILSSCSPSNPLEQFGLYFKYDILGEEDEEMIESTEGEEGEIC